MKHKKSTFEKLGSESGYGPEFSPDGPNRCKNMAWLVVKDVLGWDALEPYESGYAAIDRTGWRVEPERRR